MDSIKEYQDAEFDKNFEYVASILWNNLFHIDWSDSWKSYEYYNDDGRHKQLSKYVIDLFGNTKHIRKNNILSPAISKNYYTLRLFDDDNKRHGIIVHRAVCSTFFGRPPTLQHTGDHIYSAQKTNNSIWNLKWSTGSEQAINQEKTDDRKNAFIIIKNGIEKTAKEWMIELNYSENMIYNKVRNNLDGFSYKLYDDLPNEIWKLIPNLPYDKGHIMMSNKSRVAIHNNHGARHIRTANNLYKQGGYPSINNIMAHQIAMEIFCPEKIDNKKDGEIICHKNDNKLDFSPDNLYFGSASQNGTDAHDNGSFDETLSERKCCVARRPDGTFVKQFDSRADAVKWLHSEGFENAIRASITMVIDKFQKNRIKRKLSCSYAWTSE